MPPIRRLLRRVYYWLDGPIILAPEKRIALAKRIALVYYRRKYARRADYREWLENTGRRRVSEHFAHYVVGGDYDPEHLASQLFELTRTVGEQMGKVTADQAVLDLGASDGLFLENVLPGFAIGVNILWECVSKVKAEGFRACRGDVEHLPFQPKSFDHIICCETLEHVPNPILALNELERVCRGRLYLSIPWLPETRVNARQAVPHPEDKHIFEFSEGDFPKILSHTNWRVVHHSNVNVFPGTRNPFYRYLLKRWLFPSYFPKLQFYTLEPKEPKSAH